VKNEASNREVGRGGGVVLEREVGDIGDLAISSAGFLAATRKVAFRIEELLSARSARCHSSQRFSYFTPCKFPALAHINEKHSLIWQGRQNCVRSSRVLY